MKLSTLSPSLFFASLILTFALIFMPSRIFSQKKKWYKGNLHTHSYWSDGDHYPEYIIKWYKEHDYDFIALSEHNILAIGEKEVNIRKRRNGSKALKEYLDAFGETWVNLKVNAEGDTIVQLKTWDEYMPLFEDPGEFLIIQSEEITDRFKDKPVHINATNIQELIQPRGGKTLTEVMQNNIDQVLAQRKKTGIPMIPHINHPNFGWAMQADDFKPLNGERFFEVYNGHPAVNNYGGDNISGTEEMWDEINLAYIEMGKPLLFGLAVDDSHNYHNFGLQFSNTGRGWVMVKTASLEPASIVTALEKGDFYSTTGVKIKKHSLKNRKYTVQLKKEKGVEYKIEFIGASKGENSRILSKISLKGSKATYPLSGNEIFLRAKVISNKLKENPYKTGETETAWTQPIKLN